MTKFVARRAAMKPTATIREMLNGTVLLAPQVGVAKQAAKGWSVHSKIGAIWPSKFRPDQKTNVRFVESKAEARKLLCEMANHM